MEHRTPACNANALTAKIVLKHPSLSLYSGILLVTTFYEDNDDIWFDLEAFFSFWKVTAKLNFNLSNKGDYLYVNEHFSIRTAISEFRTAN